MSDYFPEPKSLGGRVKVELDLSNYATKVDLKTATGVDTSQFAKIVDLANLKSNVDKLNIDKLKNVPTNLNNLKSKVDKLDVDKLLPVPVDLRKLRYVYNAKIKNIEDKIPDITNLATKTTLNAKTNKVKGEIPSITNLATTVALNANEVKGEIPNITNLATTSALSAIENKIPSVSNLVKTTDYNTKISEIRKKITDYNHDKYITSPEFNKFITEILDFRLKRAN